MARRLLRLLRLAKANTAVAITAPVNADQETWKMRQRNNVSTGNLADFRQLSQRLGLSVRPKALLISCCDQLVDASLLTATGPGELLTIKTPGNIVKPYDTVANAESAAIEMAITELQVSDVIVCGHSPCRCMSHLMNPEDSESMPALASYLKYADASRRILEAKYDGWTEFAKLQAVAEENVLVQLDHLRTHPCIASAVACQTLRLHAWFYDAETNSVSVFVPEIGNYVTLANSNNNARQRKRTASGER